MTSGGFIDGDQVFVNLKAKSKDGSSVDLGVMANHIIDFSLTTAQGGATEATIRLYDETFNSLEDVIFNSGVLDNNPNRQGQTGQPVLAVNFGWVKGDKSLIWDLNVHDYNNRYELGKGSELELMCSGGMAGGIFRRGNNRFTQKDSITKVVSTIARENGIPFEVEEGELALSVRQNGKSGLRFLQWLAANGQFVSKSGNKNYAVWIGNLRGKPTLICQCSTTITPSSTEWTYLYGRDSGGQVKDWEVGIKSKALFALGSGGMSASIINKGDKTTKDVVVNSRTVTGVAVDGAIIPEVSNTPAPLRLAFETEQAALSYAADKWVRLNNTNVTGRLTIIGNPSVKPGDRANVIVITGSNGIDSIRDIHPTSGSYHILKVSHNITLGDYTTTLECVRRGNLKAGVGGTVESTGTQAAISALQSTGQALLSASDNVRNGSVALVIASNDFRSAYGAVSNTIQNGFVQSVVNRATGTGN